jgi:uncharacterized membrane protein
MLITTFDRWSNKHSMTSPQQPLRPPEMPPQPDNGQEQEKETGRIEAFSDGIFAVAITLLVLNIQIPPQNTESALADALLSNWHTYLAFATSFSTIGVMWINHHRLFNLIKFSDNGLLVFNLLLLLFIVFVPFPTALLTQYLEPGYRLPAIMYSATFVVLAMCFNLLWRYASHHNRLLGKNANPHTVRAINQQYRWGPVLYLVAFGLAFFSPPASVAWNLLLALFFALPAHIASRIARRRQKSAN